MIGEKKMRQITAPTAMAIIDQIRRSRSSRRWSTTDIVPVASPFRLSFSFSFSAAFRATRAYPASESAAGPAGGGASPAGPAPPAAGAAVPHAPAVWRPARPTCLPISGSFSGPKTSRATTKIATSSNGPRLNIASFQTNRRKCYRLLSRHPVRGVSAEEAAGRGRFRKEKWRRAVPAVALLLDVGDGVGQLLEPRVVLQHEVEVEQVVVRYRGARWAGFPQLGREVPDVHLDAGAGEEVDDAGVSRLRDPQ